MRTISEVLDQAKKAQKVRSYYKLALCLGIGETSLTNYRSGRSLPDEKTCEKLSIALGEDPIILMVEIQAQRTKDDSARAKWAALAKRLQMGVGNLVFLSLLAIFSIAASALPASAKGLFASDTKAPTVYYVKSVKEAMRLFSRLFVIFCNRVSFFWLAGISFPKFRVSNS